MISSSQRPLPDNTQHSQRTSIPPVGFEPTISATERPQTYILDRAATGTGDLGSTQFKSMLRSLSPIFGRHFVNRALATCFFIRLRVGWSGVTLPTEELIFLFSTSSRTGSVAEPRRRPVTSHQVPKLRMSGAIPTRPPYAQGHFTFYRLIQLLDFSESCVLSNGENGKFPKY